MTTPGSKADTDHDLLVRLDERMLAALTHLRDLKADRDALDTRLSNVEGKVIRLAAFSSVLGAVGGTALGAAARLLFH